MVKAKNVLIGGGLISLSLLASVWTYNRSLSRQEVMIAELETAQQQGNPTTITFPKAGEVRVYLFKEPADNDDFASYKLKPATGSAVMANIQAHKFRNTGLKVKAKEKVTETFYDRADQKFPGFGWIKAVNNACPKWNVKKYLDEVKKNGQPIVSAQCWSDHDTGSEAAPDNNDYLVVLSYKPGTTPSPSPSVAPVTQPQFLIRSFNDKDQDAVNDSGEGGVGVAMPYRYKIDSGEWKRVNTSEQTSQTAWIKVALGKTVTIQALAKAGWNITSINPQIKTLDEKKNYIFEFGRHRLAASPEPSGGPAESPSPSPSPSPSASPTISGKQPDTGTPTGLTLGLMALIAVITVIKIIKVIPNDQN